MPRRRRRASTSRVTRRLLAGRSVLDAQHNVKELEERALGVAAAAVLPERVVRAPRVVAHTVRQPRVGHVLATGQEWSNAMVKGVRIAILVHALQQGAELVEALRERMQATGDGVAIAHPCGGNGVEHQRDDRATARLDRHRHEIEPRFVQ